MSALAKVIKKISTRRDRRVVAARQKTDRLRKEITKKSGQWEGTSIIRETRDARLKVDCR